MAAVHIQFPHGEGGNTTLLHALYDLLYDVVNDVLSDLLYDVLPDVLYVNYCAHTGGLLYSTFYLC